MSSQWNIFDFLAMIGWQWLELTVILGAFALAVAILVNWHEESERKLERRRRGKVRKDIHQG